LGSSHKALNLSATEILGLCSEFIEIHISAEQAVLSQGSRVNLENLKTTWFIRQTLWCGESETLI
jgi:hypothetical protein